MVIHLSSPDVGELEERFLVRALRSGWAAPAGPDLAAFEREVAERVGMTHAVAVNSGTAALHLALLAIGVEPGDLVVVPTLTFVATANAVRYTGAEPYFVDCDPATGNVDAALLARVIDQQAAAGRPIRAVLAVDLFGSCADYDALVPLCDAYGIPLIEDAAESLGSTRGGHPAGSFGRASALSFNGNKIATTSGGGMVLSDDGALIARCRFLATQAREPVPYYEHTDVGYNYRLSNLLAALGRAQLRRLDHMVERRRALRDLYRKLFTGPGTSILGDDDRETNAWLTVLVVDPVHTGWTGHQLGSWLRQHGIETRPVWKPMHRQPVYSTSPAALTGVADRLFRDGVALPSGSALTGDQVDRLTRSITEFLDSPGRRPR